MGTPQELLYRKYLNADDKSHIITRNIYYSQLSGIAAKYNMLSDKLTNQIVSTKYAEPDLLAVVNAINGAAGGQTINHRDDRSGIRFFAGLGVISNTLKYTGDPGSTPLLGASSSFFFAVYKWRGKYLL